jgi:hypothetical protein
MLMAGGALAVLPGRTCSSAAQHASSPATAQRASCLPEPIAGAERRVLGAARMVLNTASI